MLLYNSSGQTALARCAHRLCLRRLRPRVVGAKISIAREQAPGRTSVLVLPAIISRRWLRIVVPRVSYSFALLAGLLLSVLLSAALLAQGISPQTQSPARNPRRSVCDCLLSIITLRPAL